MKMVSRFLAVLAVLACFGCAMGEASRKAAAYHCQMGLSFLKEKDYSRALKELSEAEKITPDDPLLLNCLGQAYYFKKRFDLAEQKYLRALALRPTYTEVRNNLAVNYMEMKRWDDAIKQLTIVTDDIFYPNHDDASINLALAYYGKGDNDTALSLLRPVVSRNPANPVARMNLGRVYLALDKPALAIEEFNKATDIYQDYAKAHYNLALAYLKIPDIVAARKSFREVIRIEPDSEIGQLSREYLDMLK